MTYPPALFDYRLTPDRVPHSSTTPSVVDLQLSIANHTGRDVTCQQIGIAIAEGPEKTRLTDDVAAIASGAAAGTEWTFTGDGQGNFTARPKPGSEVLRHGESIALLLTGITVNTLPGLVSLPVYETTEMTRTTRVDVDKTTPGLGITSFGAVPIQVAAGDPTVLSWTTTGASRCTLSGGGSTEDVPFNGHVTRKPPVTTTYTLTAEGDGPPISQQVTVTVPEVRILQFTADPDTVAQNGLTTFRWSVLGATKCTINPGRHVVDDPVSGSLALHVPTTADYTLKAEAANRTDSQVQTVTVMPVEIECFTADPALLAPGESTRLEWRTTWAETCRLDGTYVDLSGHEDRAPTETTTYELRADGFEGCAARVTVAVGPTILAFGFTTDPARPDEILVHWRCAHGTFVLGWETGGDPVPDAGTQVVPVSPGSVTVSLTEATNRCEVAFILSTANNPVDRFARFEMSGPSGITSPYAPASVGWAVDPDVDPVRGEVTTAEGRRTALSGATGEVEFDLGAHPPRKELWQGYLYSGSHGLRFGVI